MESPPTTGLPFIHPFLGREQSEECIAQDLCAVKICQSSVSSVQELRLARCTYLTFLPDIAISSTHDN